MFKISPRSRSHFPPATRLTICKGQEGGLLPAPWVSHASTGYWRRRSNPIRTGLRETTHLQSARLISSVQHHLHHGDPGPHNSLSSKYRAAHLRLQELNAAHLENDTFFFGRGKVTEILSLYVTQLAPASDMAATQRTTHDERRTTCASGSLPMQRPRRQRHVTLFDS